MDGSDPIYAIQEDRKIARTSDAIREMDNTTMPAWRRSPHHAGAVADWRVTG
jgi:hypothetical protein